MTDAPPAAAPSRPSSRSWTTLWYYAVVVLTFGLLSGVPFVHAATRLRGHWRTSCVVSAVLYTAIVITAIVLTPSPPDPRNPTGGLIILCTIVAATVHLTFVRHQIHSVPRPADPNLDPSVAAVLDARRRRFEARRILERDPWMGRELRIGRPDLPHEFDDGGLVDLNSAPAAVIAETCGVDLAVAQSLVNARTAAGTPFVKVDDVFPFSDVPYALWDRIRERAVVVP